jgi:hypothetical protein
MRVKPLSLSCTLPKQAMSLRIHLYLHLCGGLVYEA